MKIVSDINLISKQEWSDFVKAHPDGNVFQTPQMYDVYDKTRNYKPVVVAAIGNDGKFLGILVAVIQKEYSGLLGRFTARSIIFGGPVIEKDNVEILDAILMHYLNIIRTKAIYSQVRNFQIKHESLKLVLEKKSFLFEDHLNIKLNLAVGKEMLWQGFSRSRKKGIKKALEADFSFESGRMNTYIEDFYLLLNCSYNRIKLPIPSKEHFDHISEVFDQKDFRVFIIKQHGNVVVALFALIFKSTMYGYYLGTTNDQNIIKNKPGDLLFWEVFKWAMEHDIDCFDWMGAGKPDKDYGVRDFKLQFGGNCINLGRFEIIHQPLLFKISKLGLKIWKKVK